MEEAQMSKHTPGPWYVGAMNDCLFVIDKPPRPSNDDVVPEGWVTYIAKLDYKYDAASANARFIAAAPDLLRTLVDTAAHLAAAISLLEKGGKAAKKAAPSDKMFDQMLKDYRASLSRARAAVAIAKGEA
jgi:hypothetical protein